MTDLKQAILGTILRRLIGYLGVAGVVGIENDFVVLAGAIAAVGTIGWSIIEKIRAAKA